jgi:hypothetical protein
MCDKKSIREPEHGRFRDKDNPELPALPKSTEQLMDEFNKLRKGTYMAFQEDYLR